MKKQTILRIVLPGLVCAGVMAASSWYAICYNDGRLVKPMDFSTYVFSPKDLPMLVSLGLVLLYVTYLVVLWVRAFTGQRRSPAASQFTRTVSPKLGFLGLLGFLGFSGFWTYQRSGSVFPFVFFIFFGFFGFFYEGKMSHTLMDERYKENWMRAHFNANQTALKIIFIATILLGQGALGGSLARTFMFYIIAVTLALALGIFLGEYLLYRYDHDEQPDESEG